jgi:hypothetical protein
MAGVSAEIRNERKSKTLNSKINRSVSEFLRGEDWYCALLGNKTFLSPVLVTHLLWCC